MSYYKYIAVVVIVLSLVAAWLLRDTEEVVPRGDVVIEIVYTDDGYVPNEVTVKKGEAVRWINRSSRDMWPASAVHPTHSLYPEKSDTDCLGSSFDACEYLPPDSRWEYTFQEVGDWRFHDHIRPSKTGIVHVDE